MAKIHPTAIVEDGAILADDCEIGPLCFVGSNVKIGAGTKLIAQCHISGYTTIGENNLIYPFAALGCDAQDHALDLSTKRYLKVGDHNIFREHTAIHTGTLADTTTEIGSHCMFMNCSHVAHNCKVGNNVHYISLAVTGGYAEVQDNAILSGLVAIHQFCRVGRFAIISGCSAFSQDVPPFMMAEGRNGGVKMINKIGLQRAGFDAETINVIKHIFRIYYRSGLIPSKALEQIRTELPQIPEVQEFLYFCANSKKGVVPPNHGGHRN